jgi:hypothetical protein
MAYMVEKSVFSLLEVAAEWSRVLAFIRRERESAALLLRASSREAMSSSPRGYRRGSSTDAFTESERERGRFN